MSDYISREAAMQVLCDACGNAACPKGLIPKCSYGERMQSIPAADVREVVLCRGCKYRQYDALFKQSYCNGQRVTDDWFCADGERLTNCGADMRGDDTDSTT